MLNGPQGDYSVILAAEIALLVMGLITLFTGRGLGKNGLKHPHYRLLGAFAVTLLPVALASLFVFGIVWAMTHPNLNEEDLMKSVRWPAIGIEAGIVLVYVIICTMWEKSIRRRAEAAHVAMNQTALV
jgi:hypothetical protein